MNRRTLWVPVPVPRFGALPPGPARALVWSSSAAAIGIRRVTRAMLRVPSLVAQGGAVQPVSVAWSWRLTSQFAQGPGVPPVWQTEGDIDAFAVLTSNGVQADVPLDLVPPVGANVFLVYLGTDPPAPLPSYPLAALEYECL